MSALNQLITAATTALRNALGAFLGRARTALASQGLTGWPDTFTDVPRHLEPFIIEAYLTGAGQLAELQPQAQAWAADALARLEGSHWPQNTFRRVAVQGPEQWPALLDTQAHARWAQALAESEMRSAFNAGTLAAAIHQHATSPILKTWKAHIDDRTRPAHLHANGQRVPVTEPFTVDGEALMFPGDPTSASPGNTYGCRCSLRLTPAPLTASGETMPTTHIPGQDIHWSGPLAPIGVNSADMRRLGDTARLDTRELPLPLLYQPTLSQRHEGAVQGLAVLRRVWVEDGVLHGEGTFDGRDPDAAKIADKIQRGYLGWVSVDLDKALMELDESNPDQPVEVARSWRLSGATLVGQPAFDTHAKIRIVDKPQPGEPAPLEEDAELVEIAEPTGEDEGIVSDDSKIPPGKTPDIPRNPAEQAPPVPPVAPRADEPVVLDDVLDDEEDDEEKQRKKGKAVPFKPSQADVQRACLIASAIPLAPPKAWFANPRFSKPTAMHVTEQGQVYGHLAEWNRPHMSFPGQYIYAPKSPSAYREFEVGSVLTAEGDYLRVGTLTAGTSHAEHGLTASETMAFYSDTGYGAAIVRAGEDEHGIWVAGSLAPGASGEQIATLRRAPLSGDWRDNGRGLDLVAALAVNRPALPVLRASVYLHDDKPVSLVAAGVLPEADAFEALHSDAVPVPSDAEQTLHAVSDLAHRLAAALAPLANTYRVKPDGIPERTQQMQAVRARFNAARMHGVDQRMQALREAPQTDAEGD